MKNILLISFAFISLSVHSQISKIEHFYTSSPHAQELHNLFTNQLGLPVVWSYKTYSTFASGGVSLGNVVFEFVKSDSDSTSVSNGIALEPIQSAIDILTILKSADISHGQVDPNYYNLPDGTKKLAWSTLSLNQLLPDSINLFICDYVYRETIENGRNKASSKLVNNNGGILGVEYLKEIIIGTEEIRNFKNELIKLPGIKKEKDNLFTFSLGPGLRLKSSNNGMFFRILIKVKSIDNVKKQLQAMDISTIKTDKGLMLDIKILSGIQIELIE